MSIKNIKDVAKISVYVIATIISVFMIVLLVKVTNIKDFLQKIELRAFDTKQVMLVKEGANKPREDIVIVQIDDASYEYLLDRYGQWPIPRDIYANVVNYLESQKPTAIMFDLIFAKPLKSKTGADDKLANAMNSYNNVLTALNFDNQPYDVRKPAKLPKKMELNVVNNSKKVDFSKYLSYSNCRTIIPQLMNGKVKLGTVNVVRANDGILRKFPSMVMYQNKYYPHLAMLTAMTYLQNVEHQDVSKLTISKDSTLTVGDKKIPLDTDGAVILNWYGHAGSTYTYVPLYKIIKAIEDPSYKLDVNFKDKFIFIGTTATSMSDTKSVPISTVGETYPGVEIYGTFVNNFLDNKFIKKADFKINLALTLALALIVGISVACAYSTYFAVGATLVTLIGYSLLSYLVMKYMNLWIYIVPQFITVLVVFIIAYITKYIIKSKDFDKQYKLATTDALTELYNHRYFQDQMTLQMESCKRYQTQFSMIMIDIDHFKKFNDTYGHQAGDAVLKGVANTLKTNSRSTDIVCRYGGEEMCIILINTEKKDAMLNARRLCNAVASKIFKLNATTEVNVTISLGVSTYPQNGSTTQEMIEYADKCLYYAKENGRNQLGIPPEDKADYEAALKMIGKRVRRRETKHII